MNTLTVKEQKYRMNCSIFLLGDELQGNQLSMFFAKDGTHLPGGYSRYCTLSNAILLGFGVWKFILNCVDFGLICRPIPEDKYRTL